MSGYHKREVGDGRGGGGGADQVSNAGVKYRVNDVQDIAVDSIFVEAANLQIELARLAVPHSHTQSPSYTQSTEHDEVRGVQE